jgi:alpha-glucosidase
LVPAGVDSVAGNGFSVTCKGHALEIRPVAAGTVRVRYKGSAKAHEQSWAVVAPADPAGWTYGFDGEAFHLCRTGGPTLRVELAGCWLEVLDPTGKVLFSELPGGGYSETEGPGGNGPEMRRSLTFLSPAGERFYGFGEKTGPLDKRGRKMVFWNSDTPGYPVDMDPLYQSIPFFVGLREGTAYGLFLDNSHRLEFDIAATQGDRVELEADGGEIDLYFLAGPGMSDVVDRYTALTGRPHLPPRWTLGYHQARWSYYPDSKVEAIAAEFRKRDIPADAIWLDIDYMDGFRSWTWSPAGFPAPPGLVSGLAGIGFKVVAIIDPGLKVDPQWDIYADGLSGGHFLSDADGKPFVGTVWPGPSVYPDFTRKETREWWGGLVPALTTPGVRGIWLDMNEPANFEAADAHTVPGHIAADGDGQPTTMAEVHNAYALFENRATFEGLLAEDPGRRPFLLTRAGFAGIQRYAAVWTGDAASTMASLEASFTMLLGLGVSGVPMVGSDVGGWTGSPSPELYARWIAVGAVSPFFRTHVATATPDQEPWSFGVEVEDISRLLIRQRYRLLPYFYSLMREASVSGAALLRPMVWEFQADPATWGLSKQGMVGPFLMAVPVMQVGAKDVSFYLPSGGWLDLHSGALLPGAGETSRDVRLQSLPMFLREGAIVPTGPQVSWSDEGPVDPLTLELFPAAQESRFLLYEDSGDGQAYQSGSYAATPLSLVRTGSGAVLEIGEREGSWDTGDRMLRLRVRPVDKEVSSVAVDGTLLPPLGSYEAVQSASNGWWWDANDRALLVVMTDQAGVIVTMTYDPAPLEEDPDVEVSVEVEVPPGTPPDSTIHIATSAGGWTQQPLAWKVPGILAAGNVKVPRGHWFEYKYTRGGWDTVEKWGGCLEATNRYAHGQAHPVKEDRVEVWADGCK